MKRTQSTSFGLPSMLTAGCGSKPTAVDVCAKLEANGVAKNCKPGERGGLSSTASEKVVFDLVDVPEKTGQVLRFDDTGAYRQAVDSFQAAATLAGPHRYGSEKALIFVQISDAASEAIGAKAKATVDGL